MCVCACNDVHACVYVCAYTEYNPPFYILKAVMSLELSGHYSNYSVKLTKRGTVHVSLSKFLIHCIHTVYSNANIN